MVFLQRRILLPTFSVILILAGVYWFYTHYEIVYEDVYVGYQGKARYDPLLAARRLLEHFKWPVRTLFFLPDFENTLGPADTLVLRLNDTPLNSIKSQQLLNWVHSGGHLLLEVNYSNDRSKENNVLKKFTVQKQKNNSRKPSRKLPVKFTWNQRSWQVDFGRSYFLETKIEPFYALKGQQGYYFLHYRYGQGHIGVLNDLNFIMNPTIGAYDHAQFLLDLIQFREPKNLTTTVWLINSRSDSQLSLWNLIRQYAWSAVISAALLLGVWLWHLSPRFGSVLPAPARARRSLLEHIEASGRFLWQQRQVEALLAETRQDVLKRLTQIYPNRLDSEWAEPLVKQGHFSLEDVRMALHDNAIRDEAQLTRAVQILLALKTVA